MLLWISCSLARCALLHKSTRSLRVHLEARFDSLVRVGEDLAVSVLKRRRVCGSIPTLFADLVGRILTIGDQRDAVRGLESTEALVISS